MGSRTFQVKRTQFPLTPAYACTAYKVQGKTLNKVIIDLKYPPTGKLDRAYAYVALSRVKNLNDILILRPFEKKILNTKFSDDYIIECERLLELERSCQI